MKVYTLQNLLKRTINDESRITDNFLWLYRTALPSEIAEGKRWYSDARLLVRDLSAESGLPVHVCASVFSALSPSVRWEQNVIDARALLLAYRWGNHYNVGAHTYGQQLEKALALLHDGLTEGECLAILGKGLKTRNFARNLWGDDTAVTVDRHMLASALRTDGEDIYKRISLTDCRYNRISKVITELAEALSVEPCQMQAILWIAYRNRFGG